MRTVLLLAIGLATAVSRGISQPTLDIGNVVGCYDLEVRGFDLNAVGGDSVYYQPPPRVILTGDRKEEGLARGSLFIKVPEGSVPSPHPSAVWRAQDSVIAVSWSTGHIGISANLSPTPNGFSGEVHQFTDVVSPDGGRGPSAVLTAKRVECDSPTPYPISQMPRYFRTIPLSSGASLELRQPLSADIPRTPTRASGGFVLEAEISGDLRGARAINVRLDDAGRVIRIGLSYDIEALQRVRSALVGAFGRWHGNGEFFNSEEWVWQGRAESIYLIDREGKSLGLSFSVEPERQW